MDISQNQEKISQLADNRKQLTVVEGLKPSTTANYQLTAREIDNFLSSLTDLVNPQFMGWYAKCLHTLGKELFMDCVRIARQRSETPQRLLSYMLKQEMQKVSGGK